MMVPSYVEDFTRKLAPVGVKRHLAAALTRFDRLVVGHGLPINPVNSPAGREARPGELQDACVCDRALIVVLKQGFSGMAAPVSMRVSDHCRGGALSSGWKGSG